MAGFLPYSYGGQSDVNHVGDVSRSAIAEDMLQPPQLEKGQNDDTWTQAEKAKLGVMRDAGNSLSEIVKAFPMHTENSVKQHWYKWDPYYIEPGSDEENHATRSTEPLYRQITSPHSVESPDISGTRSYAPQTGKMQTDHIDEDIVKTRASDDPHPMALGRTPQYPARFSAIRGARKESGLGMDRVVTLLQGLSNSIDEYVPGRDSATKFNPQAEHGYAAQVHQPTSLPNLVQSQSFPLLSGQHVEPRYSGTLTRIGSLSQNIYDHSTPLVGTEHDYDALYSLGLLDLSSQSFNPVFGGETHPTTVSLDQSQVQTPFAEYPSSSGGEFLQPTFGVARTNTFRSHSTGNINLQHLARWPNEQTFGMARTNSFRSHSNCNMYSQYLALAGPSNSEIPRISSDTDSLISLAESLDDPDDHLLTLVVSQLRAWLFERSKSEHFCQHLQHQLTYRRGEPSTLQEQSTDSKPRSSSLPTSSVSSSSNSSSTTSVSCGPVNDGKRRQDDESGQDEQQRKKKRSAQDESENKPAPRLACLFNKYDPMIYRSNAQTNKKFEICGMHDFQNMNKLYEHLKRVHSDQPLQCPRCTCTSFGSSEELQTHQTASEPCTLVPLNAVKRMRWITHDERTALQTEISRCLRGGTDEEKWRFAYRRLFPDTNPDEIPCPYLQDPVISIVSSVVEDFEIRLRELIRSSTDLNDLESRIPIIRGQFLAQYGISTNEVEQDPPSLTSLRTMSSSPGSGRLTSMRPPDVLDLDQPQLGGDTNHDQPTLPSDSQQGLNVLPTETNAYQDAALEPLVTSDPAWLHHDDFPSLDDMPGWDPSTWNPGYETTNDASDSLYMTENTKDLHGYSALIQKESLSFS